MSYPDPTSLRLRLARKIKLLRAARGWSQETLAALAGLHRNYVSAVERGRVNVGLDNLAKLARALDVPAHTLLDVDSRPWDRPRVEEGVAAYLQ